MSNGENAPQHEQNEGHKVASTNVETNLKRAIKRKDFSWGAFQGMALTEGPATASEEPDDGNPWPSNDQDLAAEHIEEGDQLQNVNAKAVGDNEIERDVLTQEDGAANGDRPNDSPGGPARKSKQVKKEKRKAKKAQMLSWDGDEPSSEFKTSDQMGTGECDPERSDTPAYVNVDAVESPGIERKELSYNEAAPETEPVITLLQSPSDVPEQLKFSDIIEPSAVVEPRDEQAQDNSAQLGVKEKAIGGDPYNEFPIVKKSQKDKKSKKIKNIKFEPAIESKVSPERKGLKAEAVESESGDQLVVEGNFSLEPNNAELGTVKDLPLDNETESRKGIHSQADVPEIIQQSSREIHESKMSKEATQPDTPLSTGSAEMLDPEQQRQYNEEYRKQLEKELSPLREDDSLLDTQEQQAYNAEYREKLDRQLSPLRRTNEDLVLRDLHGEDVIPLQEDSAVERPMPMPNEATLHHTVLSDILEETEPPSRSNSMRDPPAATSDGLERKRSKKGKKVKKSRQPVIWEDDTATDGLADTPEAILLDKETEVAPVDLQEPIEGGTVYKDLPSPTRGSPSASRSPKFDHDAQDYFSVEPRAEAEKKIEWRYGAVKLARTDPASSGLELSTKTPVLD